MSDVLPTLCGAASVRQALCGVRGTRRGTLGVHAGKMRVRAGCTATHPLSPRMMTFSSVRLRVDDMARALASRAPAGAL
jgi:hypothetical protein